MEIRTLEMIILLKKIQKLCCLKTDVYTLMGNTNKGKKMLSKNMLLKFSFKERIIGIPS